MARRSSPTLDQGPNKGSLVLIGLVLQILRLRLGRIRLVLQVRGPLIGCRGRVGVITLLCMVLQIDVFLVHFILLIDRLFLHSSRWSSAFFCIVAFSSSFFLACRTLAGSQPSNTTVVQSPAMHFTMWFMTILLPTKKGKPEFSGGLTVSTGAGSSPAHFV